MRVGIVGAGVVGLACALELLGRGAEVEIFERGETAGAKACSWWAGGMLAPWCEGESAEEPVVRLEAEAIAALEPDLAGRFGKALFFESEGHLDPRLALAGLAAKVIALGGRIHYGCEVAPEDVAADAVLDCRGLAAREALPDLRGVKGEMLLLRTRDVTLSRPVRLLHPRIPLYVVPRADGIFMVGATMIEGGDRGAVTARSMLELLGGAYALHPAFGEAQIVEIGVDARPAFPDNLPRLTRRGRVIHVNGFYRHGFLLSPAMARLAADALLDPNSIPERLHDVAA
ncbi:MAG: thiamine biosynthesis protein thio [Bosea sp. 32-68-6]|nr:MAG: thiamine biosynthesis protein thio [Bosea sp. 32-68-6]